MRQRERANAFLVELRAFALIAWAYLVTNAARVFTHVPQILTVWLCGDGARSISLLT